MGAYSGKITSLGDYVELTTTIIREDEFGNQRVGAFDQQKERFINGLTIGGKKFGRMSCPVNLYPHFEVGKEVTLYTWVHPFLGYPPLRTGIIGLAYKDEPRAYVIGAGQMVASLVALALLPMLWLIPGIVVGGIVNAVLHTSEAISAFIVVLVALSPWIAGALMAVTYVQMKAAHPLAAVPKVA